MHPEISVYITSFNQRKFIADAIESVLNQTLQPYELIIVDDCSTDGSQKIIAEYAQRYPGLIRPFYHENNIGIPANRNFALTHITGDLVTYLDSDDRFLPQKLELELKAYLTHPDANIVYSNYYYIDKYGKRLRLWANDSISLPSGDIFIDTVSNNFPGGIPYRNEMVSLSAISSVGFYDEQFQLYEDWDLRIRLTNRFKAIYCVEPLLEYRLNPEGVSTTTAPILFGYVTKVLTKNNAIISTLSTSERKLIDRRLSKVYAGLAKGTLFGATTKDVRKSAFIFFRKALLNAAMEFNMKLVVKILCPRFIYESLKKLKAIYQNFFFYASKID